MGLDPFLLKLFDQGATGRQHHNGCIASSIQGFQQGQKSDFTAADLGSMIEIKNGLR